MNTKKITIALVILLLAGAATINVFVANKSTKSALSGLSLMNVEALSDGETNNQTIYKRIEEDCNYTFTASGNTNITIYGPGGVKIVTLKTNASGTASYSYSGKVRCAANGDEMCEAKYCSQLGFM
jgi:hypothetical protein